MAATLTQLLRRVREKASVAGRPNQETCPPARKMIFDGPSDERARHTGIPPLRPCFPRKPQKHAYVRCV